MELGNFRSKYSQVSAKSCILFTMAKQFCLRGGEEHRGFKLSSFFSLLSLTQLLYVLHHLNQSVLKF